jgi:hypothetical protein
MNKVLLAGVATMLAFHVSIAHAAITRAADVRRAVVEDNKKALDKGAIDGVTESDTAMKSSVANLLVGVARNADTTEMSEALSRSIKVSDAGNVKEIPLMNVGRQILMAKQSLDKMNRNDLDAQGQAHYDELRQALETSSQFLTLASKTADVRAVVDAQTQKQEDAFNKQLSLIPDLLNMDTRELKSHVDIMQAAINAKVSPDMKGAQAYYSALKAKYGDKTNAKLDEILGCAR